MHPRPWNSQAPWWSPVAGDTPWPSKLMVSRGHSAEWMDEDVDDGSPEGSIHWDASFLRPYVARIKFPDPLSRLKEAIKRLPDPISGDPSLPSTLSFPVLADLQLCRVISQMSLDAALALVLQAQPPPPIPLELWDIHTSCSTLPFLFFFFQKV